MVASAGMSARAGSGVHGGMGGSGRGGTGAGAGAGGGAVPRDVGARRRRVIVSADAFGMGLHSVGGEARAVVLAGRAARVALLPGSRPARMASGVGATALPIGDADAVGELQAAHAVAEGVRVHPG